MHILDKIKAYKLEEIAKQKKQLPLNVLKNMHKLPKRPFYQTLKDH